MSKIAKQAAKQFKALCRDGVKNRYRPVMMDHQFKLDLMTGYSNYRLEDGRYRRYRVTGHGDVKHIDPKTGKVKAVTKMRKLQDPFNTSTVSLPKVEREPIE